MPSPEYTYSELPAIELFQALGYQYYNANKEDERNSLHEVLLKERLEQALKRLNPWLNASNLNKAVEQVTLVTGTSLMEINQTIWNLIRGAVFTVKQVINGEEGFHVVRYLEYEKIEQNDFLVVNQMKYKGRLDNSIPDLVVYINGLPLVVIECKSPSAGNAWDSAYSDLVYYQENVEKLFYYNQFCVGLWQVGGCYGAIGSPKHFYSVYKPPKDEDWSALLGEHPSQQALLIYGLFRKEVLLDLVRNFVLFELDEGTTIKKLPRYQQLRATNKTIAKLQAGEGGVVWHTQGSGKSITMAYVTRKLQAPEFGFDNPTVIVMTDRKDLDQQITTTFQNVGFKNVHQASSVVHLDKLLRNDYGGIITTTLQKFQETESKEEDLLESDQTSEEERGDLLVEKVLKEGVLTKITKERQGNKWVEIERTAVVLEELSNKENLYILVDEAHRSHYGFLAAFMRTVLPKAKFVAFTGTPISKDDKSTLGEFYGGEYIDVYTIKESVEDGATVPLLYDEGIAQLDIKKEALDKDFEVQFGDAPIEKREKLTKAALKKYQLSWERIEDICRHLLTHYKNKIYPEGHKAMLVCNGRLAALRYQEVLLRLQEEGYHDFTSKVIISLGTPKSDPIAKAHYEDLKWNEKHPDAPKPILLLSSDQMKAATEHFKLPFGAESDTEKSGQKKHDNTNFLIVSDMLLTGYDAPIASCLYLDKPLKEHNLLQAIARVNRSRKGKNAGYIIDYNGISAYLIQALEIFSGDLRPDDLLKNLNEELPKLEMEHTKLLQLFRPLKMDRNYRRAAFIDAALRFIEPIDKRDAFKTLLKAFNKAISIVLPNPKAMKFQSDFKLFNELKLRAKNAFPEDAELKITALDNQLLQAMIDEHLKSTGVGNLLLEPISIIDKDKFREEILNSSPSTKELKMRNNLKHVIRVGLDKNPAFFKPLAQRLEDLLAQRKEARLSQRELLRAYTALQDEIISTKEEGAKKGFNTERKRAVFNAMKVFFVEGAEDATRTIFDLVKGELEIIGWESKGRVLNDMESKIRRFLSINMERSEAKEAAKNLVTLIKKNKDA
ncbi:MAG: type I restriction endonuclease subunit R [Aureispira sp.]